MMKSSRLTRLALAVLLLGLVLVPTIADDDHAAAEITLKGEILDMACYIAHEARGEDHADCAKRCVKGGQPMGLLTEDGTVYLLYASHSDASAFEQAKEFAGKNVELKGAQTSRAGIKGVEVRAVKAL
jgi:hypothetical protein